MKSQKNPERARKIQEAFEGRGPAGQTGTLYRWLWDRYAELSSARRYGGKVDWTGVATELTALGIKQTGGHPVKPSVVRKTWYRVEKAKQRERERLSLTAEIMPDRPKIDPLDQKLPSRLKPIEFKGTKR